MPVEYGSSEHLEHVFADVVMATVESQIQTLSGFGVIRAGQLHVPVLAFESHEKEKPERHPQALEFDGSMSSVP